MIIFWAFISWVNTNHALLRAPLVDWWLPTTFSKSVIRTSLFKSGDICINPLNKEWKELVAGTMDTEPTMVALMRLLKDLCADHEGDAEFHECF